MTSAQEDQIGQDKRSGAGSVIEFFLIVAVALGLAIGIQAFLVKPFRIPSASMEPTLDIGQRVLVSRVNYKFSDPDRGDVVVFKPPRGADDNTCGIAIQPNDGHPCSRPTSGRSDQNFIKRIVAGPGDRLKVIAGRAIVNGKRQDEPFIEPDATCPICNLPKEIRVPPGHFFMMGDNRGESADSREWGPVPEDSIVGQAFFTYWPPRRVGIL
ncbi:MAG TPA: signal peptidase I [Thermoleophilaceae bacterium]|jgi:signal peptidase I